MKDIKDYLHFYINTCDCTVIFVNDQVKSHFAKVGETVKFDSTTFYIVSNEDILNIKLILRPLSSMTEEDFKEVVRKFWGNGNYTFSSQGKVWYACSRELDTDYQGTIMDYINDCGDDDPANVIMCDQRSKHITYGWLIYEETYHSFSVTEEAEIVKILSEMGFDLFGLIESGLAIEKK